MTESSQEPTEQSDSVTSELDVGSSFVGAALLKRSKLKLRKRKKKPAKRETHPPKVRLRWRPGTKDGGSHSTPSPALPPAEMKIITIIPPVPFEATCPGPPSREQPNPLSMIHNGSNVLPLPNPLLCVFWNNVGCNQRDKSINIVLLARGKPP